MLFLEAQRFRLTHLAARNWHPRSPQLADFPTSLNDLRVTRAVNTHALVFPLRPTAPRMPQSFSENMLPEGNRGSRNYQVTPSGDLYEVQEY